MTGTVDSSTTERIRPAPPRGISTSTSPRARIRCLTDVVAGARARAARRRRGSPAASSAPRAARRRAPRWSCTPTPSPRSSTALPLLSAEPGGVDGDVGAGLVDDPDDAERHPDLAQLEAVGQRGAAHDLADRVGQRRRPRAARRRWRRPARRSSVSRSTIAGGRCRRPRPAATSSALAASTSSACGVAARRPSRAARRPCRPGASRRQRRRGRRPRPRRPPDRLAASVRRRLSGDPSQPVSATVDRSERGRHRPRDRRDGPGSAAADDPAMERLAVERPRAPTTLPVRAARRVSPVLVPQPQRQADDASAASGASSQYRTSARSGGVPPGEQERVLVLEPLQPGPDRRDRHGVARRRSRVTCHMLATTRGGAAGALPSRSVTARAPA